MVFLYIYIKTTTYLIDLGQIYDLGYEPTTTLYKTYQNKL